MRAGLATGVGPGLAYARPGPAAELPGARPPGGRIGPSVPALLCGATVRGYRSKSSSTFSVSGCDWQART